MEYVFPLAQLGDFQDLFALQRAIGLHIDFAHRVIRILEEKRFAPSRTPKTTPAQTSPARAIFETRTITRRLRSWVNVRDRTFTSSKCCWRRCREFETR